MKNGTLPAPKAGPGEHPAEQGPPIPVVGIGASAGGLQAFLHLLEAVPENAGMAFVLIQHLSPTHESMMAELLGASTHMTVRQIDHDMPVERDCVYVNAPGLDVVLSGNMLVVSERPQHKPERLPFDLFLQSLAVERTGRAMCVVLSGMGHDGSKGAKAIKHLGGFVIAQDPGDAEADGMPQSAIDTGDVDAVLTAPLIPAALMNWNSLPAQTLRAREKTAAETVPDWLSRIVKILLERTGTDFSQYKPGTLVRRITRRMSMLSATILEGTDYIKILLDNPAECEALAADLMINVTRFFRDPEVFEYLEHHVLPELVSNHDAERPFRVWVAGCSSGEEAWSLAMLLREAIDADGRKIRLQILASDIDADAIATARAGLYPSSIAKDISPQRLARFFTPDERGFRVRDDLRSQTVFTVQNLLSDPPFARLNMVSCRNVLIYLGPEAQAKVIAHFEFALIRQGILLLGASETGGDISGRFEVVSQPARIYRRLGRPRQAEPGSESTSKNGAPEPPDFFLNADSMPEVHFADVCRRAIAQHYTPASVLVNRQGTCLHFLGPVDEFLDVPEGSASLDILPMVPQSLRSALRSAIAEVGPERRFIQLPALSTQPSGQQKVFTTDVRYAPDETVDLVLITFRQFQTPDQTTELAPDSPSASDALRLAELAGLRQELAHASRLLALAQESERKTRREHVRLNE
ncbi:MAG: CheR family methyltransferase, partial [Hyphomonas sp.]|nr:CheR family methyltransferase [Hyphomonas sp.]